MKSKIVLAVAALAVIVGGGVVYAVSGDDAGDRTAAIGESSAAATTELIQDGGFEHWDPDQWQFDSRVVVVNDEGRTGTHSLRLGELDYLVTDRSYQEFTIPANATTLALSFWLKGVARGPSDDYLVAELTGTGGMTTFMTLGKFTERRGYYTQRTEFTLGSALFNMASLRGQTVALQFRNVQADPETHTRFYVDDVSLQMSTTTSPNLNVRPATGLPMTFTAALGGANPAAKSLDVQNTVFGSRLNFTVADDMSWLSVTPTTGTLTPSGVAGPSVKVTASVNIAGLSAGTYTGTIKLTGTGATNSPTSAVPVTLIVQGPKVNVSPASLSFTGTLGGTNPAAKTLAVSRGTSTTGAFTAAAAPSWLRVTPASGTAPATGTSSATVSVVTTGLALGIYSGTVTVSATSTTKPTAVPVTLEIVGPIQLMANGGLEQANDPDDGPWVLSGAASWYSSAEAHTGTKYLRLGKDGSGAAGTAYQEFTVPANVTTADLTFWLRQVDPGVGGDLYLEITSAAGGTLRQIAYYNGGSDSTYSQQRFRLGANAINLAEFRGKTIRVQFRAVAAPSGSGPFYGNRFFVDDVSLNASTTATPNLAVSPSALSFTATAGAANPAAQALSIRNTVLFVPMSFTVADDTAWLSATPASGTFTATTSAGSATKATVTVNTAGLPAGIHRGVITVTASGASATPFTVPVTLDLKRTSTDLVRTGDFERGPDPWVQVGSAAWTADHLSTGEAAYEVLGGANAAAAAVFQTLTIPAAATTANLTFQLSTFSDETTATAQYDRLFVEITNAAGDVLQQLATFSNLDKSSSVTRGTYNLLAFRGQRIRLQFRAVTDESLPSTFAIDNVSIR